MPCGTVSPTTHWVAPPEMSSTSSTPKMTTRSTRSPVRTKPPPLVSGLTRIVATRTADRIDDHAIPVLAAGIVNEMM